MRKLILLFLLLIPLQANAKYLEKDYQKYWCGRVSAKMEYRLPDKARVDCITDEYAIEVEFAKKWAESIGQSLYYGLRTNRKPAVLIISGKKDKKYLDRLNVVAKQYGITVFIIDERELDR